MIVGVIDNAAAIAIPLIESRSVEDEQLSRNRNSLARETTYPSDS